MTWRLDVAPTVWSADGSRRETQTPAPVAAENGIAPDRFGLAGAGGGGSSATTSSTRTAGTVTSTDGERTVTTRLPATK
ncbi:hypothetical protein AB0D11_26660 [Streptomyces monashensis]|uniref:hypothetical protein n=1 Tax=Streptomyces monashensis TaxID=1678012 RepID=UPI0033D13EF6